MFEALQPFARILRFGLVGALTAAIYFLLLWFCKELLSLRDWVAVSIAYFCSVAFHFQCNRQFTFNHVGSNHLTALFRYLVVLVINYGLTLAIVSIAKEQLHLNAYIGVCISVPATMIVGYMSFKQWVFKDV